MMGSAGLLAAALIASTTALAMGGGDRERSTTAVDVVAAELARRVTANASEPPIALHLEGSAPELTRGLGTLLAARLGRAGRPAMVVRAADAAGAESAARQEGARTLLRARVELEHGLLRVRGDGFSIRPNFWSGRSKVRRAGEAFTVEASSVADAHALALAAAVPPVEDADPPPLGLARVLSLPARIAALAAGDLDGDGLDELVALTETEVVALDGRGTVLARAALDALPLSDAPGRDPYGWVEIADRVVHLALVGRQGVAQLTLARGGLEQVSAPATAPPLAPGRNHLEPPGLPAHWSRSSRAGASLLVTVEDPSLWFFTPGSSTAEARIAGLAAASALVDVDGDGEADLATSLPSLAPAPDELSVYLRPPPGEAPVTVAALTRLVQLGLEPGARVMQLQAARLESGSRDALVVGVWLPDGTSELRVLGRWR